MAAQTYEERKEYHAAYYRRRAEHFKAWRDKPETKERKRAARLQNKAAYRLQHNARNKVWRQKHPDAVCALTRDYQTRKLNARPVWANEEAIKAFYSMAKEQRIKTGLKFHVDHIVPLRSKLVCGLHCEHNLQVLLASENLKKSNKTWPGHPNG